MSTVFPFFLSTISLKSLSICVALILAGFLGILLIAMLNNDAVQPYNPDEKNTSLDTEYGIEALLDCNIWEWLLLICGGMIVGPILYLLPVSLPSWSYFPLIVFFSLVLYALVNRWLRRLHLKWAEEDKQKRRKRSKSHKKTKKIMTMPTIHKILAFATLCLAAVGVSSCTSPQARAAENTVPECYLTYTDGYPWPTEPPPVLRLNEEESRELLAIEAETEEDTPMCDIQITSGNPEFCIFPPWKEARVLSSLSTVKNWTGSFIPEAAAKRFDSLVKAVEARPESHLSREEVQRWHKQYRPIRYRYYYKD